ncbi:MAG: hypothetical protein E7641_08080 [Ruminococcaceae bacterium]|nr:hypothetical protein [Oscillospiraceae bacterium]
MLYKKNRAKELSDELFKNPTSEYRDTPFWSWNCKLDEKELLRQIDELKEMGYGGFHMHCRAGMSSEYLSEDFMKLIKSCVKKAKKEDMLAWLYDEDRWPSGFAGGIVTKDPEYRLRYLVFSPNPPKDGEAHIDFGCFDILLSDDGTLSSYRRLEKGDSAEGDVFYAYEKVAEVTPRYNNQTYVDTMNPKAMDRFIEVTYEAYKKAVGKDFDKTVPAIFTDEPQTFKKQRLDFAASKATVALPWTDDFDDTFRAEYGESLVDKLPELFWNLPENKPSVARYRYHAHVSKRFTEAFADRCGAWCKKNKLALTGHMMAEPTLASQTEFVGEAMPSYRSFGLPGIDMLCAAYELNTAKQCQSATRQYGREGVMSELYGVTSWDFDFRGYKLGGDWQAAMGVTVRVPHLAWVSMEGEAKRDYPATMSYQSPWADKYGYIADHFARVSTALTRGTPMVRIGVIHPIESFWLHWGPKEQCALESAALESNFENINKWLSFGGYDFDYICESIFAEQTPKAGAPLKVGKMSYDAVIVPACETLRASTLERLEEFRRKGGKLIFMGAAPKYLDAAPSDAPKSLYDRSTVIPFSRSDLMCELESLRDIELRGTDGAYTDDVLYQMRQDGDDRWVFLCHASDPYNKHLSHKITLNTKIRGEWSVKLYDTVTGDILRQPSRVKNGWTYISKEMYDYDSFLFRLSPRNGEESSEIAREAPKQSFSIASDNLLPFTLGEPNALLLDMAEYALDDEPYREREEILRADTICRQRLGWPILSGGAAQPWCIEQEPITHKIRLRFKVNSEIRVYGAMLAIENPDAAEIIWNGAPLPKKVKGYYVDRSMKTLRIPVINKGENTLELTLPLGKRTATEWCYIIGNFGASVIGSESRIIPLAATVGYGSITSQTLPFYSGTLDYHLPVTIPTEADGGELMLTVPQYKGTLVEALVDGEEIGIVAYPPYKLSLGAISAGAHTVTLRLYVPRTNGFGPVHLADDKYSYPGPKAWRTSGDSFGYEYHLHDEGIMMKPLLEVKK